MKNKIVLALLATGTIIFNLLFWHQSFGANAIMFSIFIVGASFYAFPQNIKKIPVIITTLAILLTAITIFYHASTFAIIIWLISLTLFPALIHYSEQKTIFFGFAASISDYFMGHKLASENIKINKRASIKFDKTFKIIKLSIIPMFVLTVFYFIFKKANPIFEELSLNFFITIGNWIHNLFIDLSFAQIFFTIWGFTIIIWFLYKRQNKKNQKFEAGYSDTISRRKPFGNINKTTNIKTLKIGLRNEFKSGLILILSINTLLFIVNIIDIIWVWFGFEYSQDFDLKQFVHEGTYLLIFSILLSIAIMIYFFRAKLNFYPKIKYLQVAAYIWIAQNIILTISVALRNFEYIEHFGLAYKRIGVFFFLALVIYGLITLVFKIKEQKTTYKMIKENSWAMYIGFVLFAMPDWDIIIAKTNLAHPLKENIETSYLLTLDDKVLPLIDQRQDILLQSKDLNTYKYFYKSYQEVYDKRVDDFIKKYHKKTFIARNYADNKAFDYFKTKYPDRVKKLTTARTKNAKPAKDE